ncbi:rhomboid family intramembrane serine protease [Streptomyces sp. NPDC047928]|uniref:rhomboid family intramembrane serine protease n=1 Tax=unclassified Streptomyces TaxID=2593676 RepID=UPI00371F9F4D
MEQEQAPNGLSSCYRHPGVETGIRCTRCERPICPDCMVEASVGFQCPECVRGGSGSGGRAAANASRPRTIAGGAITAGDPQLITKIIIALNALVFVLVLTDRDRFVSDLALVGAWPPASLFPPGVPYVPTEGVAAGELYRLVTSVFLHEQVWHIAFNMLGVWWLGGPLEAALGRARYVALYLLSGLAGSAFTYLIAPAAQGSLGASGAVFGLLGATVVLMRRLNQDLRPVVALLVLNLALTFLWEGIAWQAHIGGLIAGAVIAYGMVHAPRDRRALTQWGTCGLVLLLTVVTVILRTLALT